MVNHSLARQGDFRLPSFPDAALAVNIAPTNGQRIAAEAGPSICR